MRILMINYEFPPLGGGAGNATYYLLKEFSKYNDLEIDLVTSSTKKYHEEQFAHNIKIYYLDIGKNKNLHYQSNLDLIRYSWKAYFLCQRLKKKKQYDLIHAFFGIPCGFIAMLLNIPYVVSLRGSDVPFYNPRFRLLDKLIFQRLSRLIWSKTSAVVANSQGLKELARKTNPNQKINIIYNGIDINEFQPRGKTNDTFVVLSTSRFIRRKGIEYLIAGFAKFQKNVSNAKLILVGSGDLEDVLKNQVRSEDIASKVEFRGTVSHNDINKIYQEADVFVLPSLNEGMSNSVLEAMASGLPIIATNTGGIEELIKDNGIIIPKKDANAIARALEKIFNNKNLIFKMRQASRRIAEAMSWSKIVKAYLNLYQNV